jgi:hypothetical protein
VVTEALENNMEEFKGYTREKWEEFGLFESTPEDRKDKAVRALNLAVNWINNNAINSDSQLSTLPVTIILLIVNKVDVTDEEVLNICKEVRPAIEAYDFDKFFGISQLGLECEFMDEFTKHQIAKLQQK